MKAQRTATRHGVPIFFGLLALVFGSLVMRTTANAGWDGQDPTSCTGASSPIGVLVLNGYGGIAGGYVDFRYSTGCGIAWTRVCLNSFNGYNGRRIERTAPVGHTATLSALRVTGGAGSCTGGLGIDRQYTDGLVDSNCTAGWGGACKARSWGKIFWNPAGGGTLYNSGYTGTY